MWIVQKLLKSQSEITQIKPIVDINIIWQPCRESNSHTDDESQPHVSPSATAGRYSTIWTRRLTEPSSWFILFTLKDSYHWKQMWQRLNLQSVSTPADQSESCSTQNKYTTILHNNCLALIFVVNSMLHNFLCFCFFAFVGQKPEHLKLFQHCQTITHRINTTYVTCDVQNVRVYGVALFPVTHLYSSRHLWLKRPLTQQTGETEVINNGSIILIWFNSFNATWPSDSRLNGTNKKRLFIRFFCFFYFILYMFCTIVIILWYNVVVGNWTTRFHSSESHN